MTRALECAVGILCMALGLPWFYRLDDLVLWWRMLPHSA